MTKLYAHSLFSVAFFIIRFFILDGAASPAYTKAQVHYPVSTAALTTERSRPLLHQLPPALKSVP